MDQLFEKASRMKLRFGTNRGELPVEDLWDLSLEDLDRLAKAINKQIKAETEESFIVKKRKTTSVLETSLDILKHIIGVKQDEADKRTKRAERRAELETMKSLLAEKHTEKLKGMSLDEISQKIAELEEADKE